MQNNAIKYATAIQQQLSSIVAPVPVYAGFNRNWATEPKFVRWQLRNIHQPVYAGPSQNNKGIDMPVAQVSIFTQTIQDGFVIAQQITDGLHGYAGQFGGATGFNVGKVDIHWLYNSYDNDTKMAEVFLDMMLYVQTGVI